MSVQPASKLSHSTVIHSQGTKSLIEYLPEAFQQRIKKGTWSWFLVLISGALLPLTFAPFNTYNSLFSYLIFFPLALFLFQLLHAGTAKEAFFKGWLFGIGLFSVGVSWLYVAIHDFGAAHWSLAGGLTGLFIALIALFYALLGWSLFKIRAMCSATHRPINHNILILFYLPVLWVFFEWLRSWLLTGFPWLLAGYPLIETPLSGFAPIAGIYGMSLLAAFISALLIARINPFYSIMAIVLLAAGGGLLGQVQWSEPHGQPLSVALIQGNVDQAVKWDRGQLEKTQQRYVSLSQAQWQNNDVIIWPENAIPMFYHKLKSLPWWLNLKARL